MRPHLLLRLDDHREPALQIRTAGGDTPWQAVAPAQLRAQLGRGVLSVLVPGEEVLLTHARLAPMGAQRRRRALPFALEEELADDIERLHFTPGTAHGDALPVAVVASERLACWLTLLDSAGVRARLVTPDVLALPWAPDGWSVLLAGDRAWVRLGRQGGFVTEADTLAPCLDAALRERAGAPPAHVALYAAPGDDAGHEAAARLQAGGIALTQHREREQPLDWLGAGLDAGTAIDLLTGIHGAAVHAPPRRAWARSAALLLALSVLHASIAGVQNRRAQAGLDDVTARIEALYEEIYPGEPVPARPHARMARDLAARSAADASSHERMLGVLAPAARRLGEVPGWELQRLDFSDGRLDLDLRVPDVATLDRVQRVLTHEAALSVERVSASAAHGAAEARLRLRPATAPAR